MARAARLASSSWVHIDSSSCSQHGTPTNGTGRGSWGNTHWQDCACPSAARPLLPAAEWLLLLRLLRIAWPPPPPPPSSCAPPTCCAGKPGRKYPPAFAIGEAHMQANCLVQLVVLKRQAAGAHLHLPWGAAHTHAAVSTAFGALYSAMGCGGGSSVRRSARTAGEPTCSSNTAQKEEWHTHCLRRSGLGWRLPHRGTVPPGATPLASKHAAMGTGLPG